MRLNKQQRQLILDITRQIVGHDVEARLFGSRLDETRRGGDLDLLLISSKPIALLARAELKQALEARLQLPVDILTYTQEAEPTPFQSIALQQSRSILPADCLVARSS
ncbi:nucleotidyltransferase domain-containing protein [Halomonas sp. 18H]|uniref:nucleotidyltransferase domain-containing protein n=1 Tax=Halomonas almeriensis TaxID=308163 RepID=UPI002231AAC2|nr:MULTISPECIES: nucleotidyltransferase domain-containing protein [Halomonas]MCW4153017.1 nucleotidyltransferase domain-containing protein [Halomonas sp. 18H]MDN3554292.1 nucleotidyltransferase domain-containing protein [Halomonas almeriensis]